MLSGAVFFILHEPVDAKYHERKRRRTPSLSLATPQHQLDEREAQTKKSMDSGAAGMRALNERNKSFNVHTDTHVGRKKRLAEAKARWVGGRGGGVFEWDGRSRACSRMMGDTQGNARPGSIFRARLLRNTYDSRVYQASRFSEKLPARSFQRHPVRIPTLFVRCGVIGL